MQVELQFLHITSNIFQCQNEHCHFNIGSSSFLAEQHMVFRVISLRQQHAKKLGSDSLGLVDFAIGLVNSVFNLPDGQVMCFEEFE